MTALPASRSAAADIAWSSTATPPAPETRTGPRGTEPGLVGAPVPWRDDSAAPVVGVHTPGRPHGAGIVVGVVGACGGVGASVLAAALADVAARQGDRSVLVDGQIQGAGADVLLGIEDEPGLRWPDLHSARGLVRGDQVVDLLPVWRSVPVLSADRSRPAVLPADVPHGVLDALALSSDVVVHDLGPDALAEHAARCTVVVVVARCDLLSVAGGVAVRTLLAGQTSAGLVVRGPSVGRLTPHDVARAAGLDLWADLEGDSATPADLERGTGPRVRVPRDGARTRRSHRAPERERHRRGARRDLGTVAGTLLAHARALHAVSGSPAWDRTPGAEASGPGLVPGPGRPPGAHDQTGHGTWP